MKPAWMTVSETTMIELAQSGDEGRDTGAFEQEARIIYDCYNEGQMLECEAKHLTDKMHAAPIRKDYPYTEPDALDEIKAASPGNKKCEPLKINREIHYDKIYGAWLGRCAGCLLGKPIEGWRRDRITGLLKDTGNYPVKHFISSDIDPAIRDRYRVADTRPGSAGKITWINNVECAPSDDDTNYTVLYLKILEDYGRSFTSGQIAEAWIKYMPLLITCTAERVAYKNIVNLILPPMSGYHYNAYREWIGAQIRADFFGYVCPGDPEKAAEYAWLDGRVSHVRNGIYGEMFASAMIAKAAVGSDITDIIKTGLSVIPAKSRLAEGIGKVFEWYNQKMKWEDAIEKLHSIWNEKSSHHWCHVISNAMICAIALLWGDSDFEKTIGISVCAGFDTDCNAATAGSILGMILGAGKLPEPWIKPLNNKLESGICGMANTEISELASRTLELCNK